MPAMTVLEQSRRESKLLEQLLRNNARPAASVVESSDAGSAEEPTNHGRATTAVTSPPASTPRPVHDGSGSIMKHLHKTFDDLNVARENPPVKKQPITLRASIISTASSSTTGGGSSSNVTASDGKLSRNSAAKSVADVEQHLAEEGDSGRESENSPAKVSTVSSSNSESEANSLAAGKIPRRSIVAFTSSTKKGSPERCAALAAKRGRAGGCRAASDGDLPAFTTSAIGDSRSVRYSVRTHPAGLEHTASNDTISRTSPVALRGHAALLDAEDGDGSLLLDQLENANTLFDKRRSGGYNLTPLTQEELRLRVETYQRRRRLMRTALWILISILLLACVIGGIVLGAYFVETRYRQRDNKIDRDNFYDEHHPSPEEVRKEIRAKLASRADDKFNTAQAGDGA